MAKKLDQFTSCVSDEAAIFSIVTHSNRFVCPPTWRRMTRNFLVQMAYYLVSFLHYEVGCLLKVFWDPRISVYFVFPLIIFFGGLF